MNCTENTSPGVFLEAMFTEWSPSNRSLPPRKHIHCIVDPCNCLVTSYNIRYDVATIVAWQWKYEYYILECDTVYYSARSLPRDVPPSSSESNSRIRELPVRSNQQAE
jgi:hypothetical protein